MHRAIPSTACRNRVWDIAVLLSTSLYSTKLLYPTDGAKSLTSIKSKLTVKVNCTTTHVEDKSTWSCTRSGFWVC